jgi:hypothetical protein
MQNPEAFNSIAFFTHYIVENVERALPGTKRSGDTPMDLISLFRFLSQCNHQLEEENKWLLLAIDEYEAFDMKIGERIFSLDLLATMRESIQSHRRLTWLFAGSHEITELRHAPWTSYLIGTHTIKVPMFTISETKMLLTEPLKFSSWPEDGPERPQFQPEFWGDGGVERIHKEAGGWPHLVQLIADRVIDLMNEKGTRRVDADLLKHALDNAVDMDDSVFEELMNRESTLPGEWEYLTAFRHHTTQPPPDNEAIYVSLRRRLLVEEENGEWRLRVPLMERWLRKRG